MRGTTFIIITEKVYCSDLAREREREGERCSKREKKGSSDRRFYLRGKDRGGGITLLDVSQALPARHSGLCSLRMKISNGHSSSLK